MSASTPNRKTAAERAAADLARAERVAETKAKKVTDLEAELTAVRAEAARAKARVSYLGANPDLPDDVRAKYAAETNAEPGGDAAGDEDPKDDA